MDTLILAGGLGRRLSHYLPDVPKPMAPIGSRPFLEHVLDGLIEARIDHVTLSIGYKAKIIQTHFGNTYKGMRLNYVMEKKPLGTGGAIAHACKDKVDPVLVLNGDSLLKMNYRKFIEWYRKDPTLLALAIKPVMDVERYGSVEQSDGVINRISEKKTSGPGFINCGTYIVSPRIFDFFEHKETFSFEYDILNNSCERFKVRGYITDSYFIDIGIPEDYEKAVQDLS